MGLLEAFFTYRQAKSLRKAILEWAELPANLLSRRSTFSFAATVDALAMVTALWLLSFEPTWVPLNIYWGALAVVVAVIARLNRTVTWAFDEVAGAVV